MVVAVIRRDEGEGEGRVRRGKGDEGKGNVDSDVTTPRHSCYYVVINEERAEGRCKCHVVRVR